MRYPVEERNIIRNSQKKRRSHVTATARQTFRLSSAGSLSSFKTTGFCSGSTWFGAFAVTSSSSLTIVMSLATAFLFNRNFFNFNLLAHSIAFFGLGLRIPHRTLRHAGGSLTEWYTLNTKMVAISAAAISTIVMV